MRTCIAILILATFFVAVAQEPPAQKPPAQLPLQAGDVLTHIKNSVSWYRHLVSAEQTTPLANDVLLRESTHGSALKALQLAFDFGHASATLLDAQTSANAPSGETPRSTNLTGLVAQFSAKVEDLQTRIKNLDARMETAKAKTRETLRAQRSTLQAQLKFATQVLDTLKTLAAFTPVSGTGGLGPQVEELERSVPEAAHRSNLRAAVATPEKNEPPGQGTNNAAAAQVHPETAGIIGLATQIFSLTHNRAQLRLLIASTDDLTRSLDRIRTPMINQVREMVRSSEALGTISGDEDVKQLASDQRAIEALAARFKQLSTVLVPLGEQKIALGSVRGNLAQALDGVGNQYSETGRGLLLRLGVLAVAIGVVVLVSALWRRITFQYIRDARRRTQFLTLRRVVVACAIAIVVVLSFVTEFGSLATYAGLLTAGIAVALQNVILSVVAYFFLIGRYGIRSGDRVTISGVTGTVIDIGLVRIYLAELAGSGGDLHPTGRIVVYSNSVLFQPSAMFKQMPGTDYVWHTVRLVLTPESDYHLAETRMTEAVNEVYQNYRHHIEQQHANFERAVEAQMARPQPEVRLRYTDAGLEALVYYPAQIKHAALTDSQVMTALQDVVAQEPKLELTTAGVPRLVANAA